ncbi:MAG TPA: hypothetical protein ENF55_05520 [Thermoprotei archaeon]|nr:hypothetical protein [Thermoprotei archaeon]
MEGSVLRKGDTSIRICKSFFEVESRKIRVYPLKPYVGQIILEKRSRRDLCDEGTFVLNMDEITGYIVVRVYNSHIDFSLIISSLDEVYLAGDVLPAIVLYGKRGDEVIRSGRVEYPRNLHEYLLGENEVEVKVSEELFSIAFSRLVNIGSYDAQGGIQGTVIPVIAKVLNLSNKIVLEFIPTRMEKIEKMVFSFKIVFGKSSRVFCEMCKRHIRLEGKRFLNRVQSMGALLYVGEVFKEAGSEDIIRMLREYFYAVLVERAEAPKEEMADVHDLLLEEIADRRRKSINALLAFLDADFVLNKARNIKNYAKRARSLAEEVKSFLKESGRAGVDYAYATYLAGGECEEPIKDYLRKVLRDARSVRSLGLIRAAKVLREEIDEEFFQEILEFYLSDTIARIEAGGGEETIFFEGTPFILYSEEAVVLYVGRTREKHWYRVWSQSGLPRIYFSSLHPFKKVEVKADKKITEIEGCQGAFVVDMHGANLRDLYLTLSRY